MTDPVRAMAPCPSRDTVMKRSHMKQSSAGFVRERQMVRCARGVRGLRRRTRQGSSHCNPQITLTMSRSSPPKPGGARTGQGEGDTPSFDEDVSGTQYRDGHVPAMRT